MLLDLHCDTADVSARALGLRLNGALPAVLSHVKLAARHGGVDTQLVLGVIGASHVATVTAGELQFREEISCHAEGELPGEEQQAGYQMRAEQLAPRDFDRYATGWLSRVGDWHVARFPGVGPHHLTGLRGAFAADTGAWEWETMHFYPAEGLIVHTQSRFQL